jgi:hypothetical protein
MKRARCNSRSCSVKLSGCVSMRGCTILVVGVTGVHKATESYSSLFLLKLSRALLP